MEQTITEFNEAVTMLFEAYRERDRMRIEAAMRHLEFLDTMAVFKKYVDRPGVATRSNKKLLESMTKSYEER